jgi:hypothetical protein
MKEMRRSAILVAVLLIGLSLHLQPAAAAGTTATLYPVADNYPDSKYPDSAYGKVAALYVGNSYDHAQNLWGSERIYIRFDLSHLPKHQVILEARLRLWQFFAPQSDQVYEVHRVLKDWEEETQNWKNQPPCDPVKTSETTAPARTEVPVEWDITSDVKAWYSGGIPNYGTMIKVANETRVAEASSGFWSREYPVEEWKPRLIVTLGQESGKGYIATIGFSGLPNGTDTVVMVDGQRYASILSDVRTDIQLSEGSHSINVTETITRTEGVRFRCENPQIHVSGADSHIFNYTAEYYVTFSTEPSEMFETPKSGWYKENTVLAVKRLGPQTIAVSESARSVFDGWHVDSRKIEEAVDCATCPATEPTRVVVTGPLTVEGRYTTEYYLNVTSPYGNTEGSGWWPRGSVASFSVDRRTTPAQGLLGLFGLQRSFTGWVGSDNFLGLPVEPQGEIVMNEPSNVRAVWEDDWASFTANLAIVSGVMLIVAVIMIAIYRRRRRRK